MRLDRWIIFFSIVVGLLLPGQRSVAAAEDLKYIGSDSCKDCHSQQYEQWENSHHDLAMAEANARSVLGDFDNHKFENFGVTSRFFMDEGRYMVNTDGPGGEAQNFEIKYTFGALPLQQYLVEFPGGRLQVLGIAWDSREKEQGGQRWFTLYPDEKIDHTDVLHWTGPNLNWNYMCAECHSTNFEKKYNAQTRTYSSSWSEIDVACEACHGPGSAHLAWATSEEKSQEGNGLAVQFTERKGVSWQINSENGVPKRSADKQSNTEIEVCAQCHSRRGQFSDDWQPGQPLLDGFRPELLGEGLYHPDGQIQDEVYVWGSFLQSKMYQAGVTCSDCHEPHSGQLRQPGDLVCAQCHSPAKYAARQHHFHEPESAGSNCVDCHMPATNYMVVDARNDHSMRIPRPDISIETDSPNACINCHTDQSNKWAADQVKTWYGDEPAGLQNYAKALHLARNSDPLASRLLFSIANDTSQPAIARATAIANLGGFPNQRSFSRIQEAISSDDALERMAALSALQSYGPREQVLAFPLLTDAHKAIRTEAASLLSAVPSDQIPEQQRELLSRGIAEYIATQQFNADRPEAQVNLGGVYANLNRMDDSENAFKMAIELQPQFEPAYSGLAQLYSNLQRETEALAVLDRGLGIRKDSALLHHARGLSLIRLRQTEKAMESLARATRLDNQNPRYAYVFAIALNSTGRSEMALRELASAHRNHPADRDILLALVTINHDRGNRDVARAYAEKLLALHPDDPAIQSLIRQL